MSQPIKSVLKDFSYFFLIAISLIVWKLIPHTFQVVNNFQPYVYVLPVTFMFSKLPNHVRAITTQSIADVQNVVESDFVSMVFGARSK